MGAATGATLYSLLIPVLTLDNLVASFAAASAAYFGQGLSTEEGRARSLLSARTLLAEAATAWRGIVKGGVGVGGGGGAGVGDGGAPPRTVVSASGSSSASFHSSSSALPATLLQRGGGGDGLVLHDGAGDDQAHV